MGAAAYQRGFLMIAAIVLIAVGGVMAVIILTLTAGSGQGGGLHVNSTQAFFVAESGIERALYGYTRQNTACAALTYSGSIPIAGGAGSYSTTGTLYSPAATTLSANINATVTLIPVNSVAGFAPHGRIMVGAEAIHYTGTSVNPAVCGGGVPACFTGATRGAGGTTAAAHTIGSAVAQNQCLITSVATVDNTRRTVRRAVFRGAGGMVAYVHEDTLGVPYYRLWDGAAWGIEGAATNVGSEIRFIMIKAARTRNEYVMVTQSANGQIRAQIWNGTNWTSDGTTTGATRLLGTIGIAADANRRAFDVEYEAANDRAMVVYRNGTNHDPDFQIWNGTAWTAGTPVLSAANGDDPRWIEMAPHPNPLSNEIVLMIADIDDDIHGSRWNGAAWDNMGVGGEWDTTVATSTTKIMDVVYEQQGAQRAMFIWLDSTSCTANFRTWDGTALSALPSTFTAWNDCDTDGLWIQAAPDPFSDDIMVGIQEIDDNAGTTAPGDTNNDIATCFWTGAAWGCAAATHPDHGTDPEAPGGQSRVFDLIFTSDPNRAGEAWLVWGALAGGGTNIWRRPWNSATLTWGAIDVFLGPDMCFPALAVHPNSGILFAGNYEDADTGNISVTQLVNGVWSGSTTLWNSGAGSNTLDCQAGTAVHERISIATQRGGLAVFDWLEEFR